MDATISSRSITKLTGARGRMLHEWCTTLGIGATKQGAERQFNVVEALLLTLTARLHEQGLRRAEALAIALEVHRDTTRVMLDPGDQKRWLFAHRLVGDPPWTVTVVDDAGVADILAGTKSGGHVVINLRAVVNEVEQEAYGGARQ